VWRYDSAHAAKAHAWIPTAADGIFLHWVVAVISLNSISIVIDSLDVVRLIKGERTPHLELPP
jgi:hypothetical protein